jgi:hypothetical protein
MSTTKIVYWVSTALITAVMLFSVYMMFSPAYPHLGFPRYFRIELLIAKLLGLAVLLAPRAPLALKEWAYAGFAIVLVSASAAHLGSGDPIWNVVDPLGFLVVLLVSRRSMHRLRAAA